jgi:hypothetical protein
MSDLFLKNSVKNNNFANSTESSFNLRKVLNINAPNKNSITSSAIMQNINELSSTSYNNTQVGGASITSSANLSKINSNDINNLLSMLTSESNINTATEDLENKLKNMLTQEGGEYESTEMLENKLKKLLNNSTFTEEMSTERLEAKINNIQRGGAKEIFGLAGLAAAGAVFNHFSETEGEFNSKKILDKPVITKPDLDSKPAILLNNKPVVLDPNNGVLYTKPVVLPTSNNNLSATSSEMPQIFTKSESKFTPSLATTTDMPTSATSSEMPMPDKRLEQLTQEGGNNPALVAFREISKMVSEELKISNGPNCKKIAGQLQRDVKEKNSDITHDKLVAAAKKHLEANMDKYKKMV